MGHPLMQALFEVFHVKHSKTTASSLHHTPHLKKAGLARTNTQVGSGRIHTMQRSTSRPGTVKGST
jgi:hypothetical protein